MADKPTNGTTIRRFWVNVSSGITVLVIGALIIGGINHVLNTEIHQTQKDKDASDSTVKLLINDAVQDAPFPFDPVKQGQFNQMIVDIAAIKITVAENQKKLERLERQ